jgi:hypothetical protein
MTPLKMLEQLRDDLLEMGCDEPNVVTERRVGDEMEGLVETVSERLDAIIDALLLWGTLWLDHKKGEEEEPDFSVKTSGEFSLALGGESADGHEFIVSIRRKETT